MGITRKIKGRQIKHTMAIIALALYFHSVFSCALAYTVPSQFPDQESLHEMMSGDFSGEKQDADHAYTEVLPVILHQEDYEPLGKEHIREEVLERRDYYDSILAGLDNGTVDLDSFLQSMEFVKFQLEAEPRHFEEAEIDEENSTGFISKVWQKIQSFSRSAWDSVLSLFNK